LEIHRVCPTCSKSFASTTRTCPGDGASLDVQDPLVGTILDGKYRVENLVGRGGMGAVYRATQMALSRAVAVKVLAARSKPNSSAEERFRREARAIALLKHPNIVTVYDFGVTSDALAYIVLEYLAGRSLREELRRRGRIGIGEAVTIVAQVCQAASAAHAEGIVHRDLKPENVFVEATANGPVVKVFDFGIAKLGDGRYPDFERITQAGAYIGTPKYAAPEQAEGREIDARADIYAIGCMFYELVAGRAPFEARSAAALVLKHATEQPVPLGSFVPDVPNDVEYAVQRALQKHPDDRFQTARDFAKAILASRDLSSWPSDSSTPDASSSEVPPILSDGRDAVEARTETSNHEMVRGVPRPLTSFVGRSSELLETRRLVLASRLVSLAGPGGIGKTRLAIETALAMASRFPDGVWFVDLASLSDPSRVARAVADVLEVKETPGEIAIDSLCEALGERRLLIVLDNCEHVVTTAAAAADSIVRRCPNTHILITSQETLGVSGETVVRVSSLAVPRRSDATSVGSVADLGSVRLFEERAAARLTGFRVDSSNFRAVAEICSRLDGIPLAIELAASRVAVLSVEQILERLKDRFRLLTGGGRTLMPRQQTLRAAMDWSFGLLVPSEQALLRRLSVFSGSFALAAAEGICADSEVPEADVLDHIARLVDKSLVAVVDPEKNRYRLSDTIREYSWERLRDAQEEERFFEAHLDWYSEEARALGATVFPPDDPDWFVVPELDHDNYRAALAWTKRHGTLTIKGARLCSFLGRFWAQRGFWSEGLANLRAALDAYPANDPALLARIYSWVGSIEYRFANFDVARDNFGKALELRRSIGDLDGQAVALVRIGEIDQLTGQLDAATREYESALEIFRETRCDKGILGALTYLGTTALDRDNIDRADDLFREVMTVASRTGNRHAVAISNHNLGEVSWRRGDLATARSRLRDAVALGREQGNKRFVAHSLVALGLVDCDARYHDEALRSLREALAIIGELGDKRGLCYALDALAAVEASQGAFVRALRLVGFADAERDRLGLKLTNSEREFRERHLAKARESIDADLQARLDDDGRRLTAESAVSLALNPHDRETTASLETNAG
jgi:predicted ATPase